MKEFGPHALSSTELIALILGKGSKGGSVMITAQKLLSHFGSLQKILEASLEDLQVIKGLGPAKAAQLSACFEIARRMIHEDKESEKLKLESKGITTASDTVRLIRSRILNYAREQFFVITCDVRNRVIDIEQISQGSLSASIVHPRETFESAIRKHAAQIIVAHNHPSGDPNPSDEDISVTRRLSEAGKILSIPLMDHIIVTRNEYYSFMESGLL
jgi:DNA repair protein RadC